MHPDDELEPDCAAGLPSDDREVELEVTADPEPGTEVARP